jgi:hypothetical protein
MLPPRAAAARARRSAAHLVRGAVGGTERDERRRVEHAAAGDARGVERVLEAADVDAVERAAVLRPGFHHRGAVDDRVAAIERAVEGGGVGDVADRGAGTVGPVGPLGAAAHEAANVVAGRGEARRDAAAEETGDAGDEDLHAR